MRFFCAAKTVTYIDVDGTELSLKRPGFMETINCNALKASLRLSTAMFSGVLSTIYTSLLRRTVFEYNLFSTEQENRIVENERAAKNTPEMVHIQRDRIRAIDTAMVSGTKPRRFLPITSPT